jgi:hypothetical protein
LSNHRDGVDAKRDELAAPRANGTTSSVSTSAQVAISTATPTAYRNAVNNAARI